MYYAALHYIQTFSSHFKASLGFMLQRIPGTTTIVCSVGQPVVELSTVVECLCRIEYGNQGLNMAVERYICRKTPDSAAHCLPADTVVADIRRWTALLYGSGGASAVLGALRGKSLTVAQPGQLALTRVMTRSC